jgi:hypothetical protein
MSTLVVLGAKVIETVVAGPLPLQAENTSNRKAKRETCLIWIPR